MINWAKPLNNPPNPLNPRLKNSPINYHLSYLIAISDRSFHIYLPEFQPAGSGEVALGSKPEAYGILAGGVHDTDGPFTHSYLPGFTSPAFPENTYDVGVPLIQSQGRACSSEYKATTSSVSLSSRAKATLYLSCHCGMFVGQ